MKTIGKVLHLSGLIMFIGGIVSSIAMNHVTLKSEDAALVYHQRLFVSEITSVLTIPGMWILIISGGLMAFAERSRLFGHRWLIAKLLLASAVVINGAFILTPLVDQVTALAEQSSSQGHLLRSYVTLKAEEDLYGTLNFIMLIAAFFLAILKPQLRRL